MAGAEEKARRVDLGVTTADHKINFGHDADGASGGEGRGDETERRR